MTSRPRGELELGKIHATAEAPRHRELRAGSSLLEVGQVIGIGALSTADLLEGDRAAWPCWPGRRSSVRGCSDGAARDQMTDKWPRRAWVPVPGRRRDEQFPLSRSRASRWSGAAAEDWDRMLPAAARMGAYRLSAGRGFATTCTRSTRSTRCRGDVLPQRTAGPARTVSDATSPADRAAQSHNADGRATLELTGVLR